MNITLVISAITGGGAERVMVLLANYWASRGQNVTLMTLYSTDTDFYSVDPDVNRVALGLAGDSRNIFRGIRANLQRIRAMSQAIKASSPDVVISFLDTTNILTLLACWNSSFPVIVSERTDPSQINIGRFWNSLRKLAYPRATAVVVQTQAVVNWMNASMPKANAVVIANPVRAIPGDLEPWESPVKGKLVASMGRLSSEKGFDMLITAFASVSKEYPDWSLVLMGDGPKKAELESLVNEFGLNDQVYFLGKVKEPYRVLRHVDMYVLSSRREGFPNALLEAMISGLPAVSFDCNSGPADIISHEVDGLLVADRNVEQLAAAMSRLMKDESLRVSLGENAKTVEHRFSMEKIMRSWETLMPVMSDNNQVN